MKRIGIIAILIVAAGLFLTFVGFPHRYHHEEYRRVGERPALDQLELRLRLVSDAWSYLLGAPVKTGGPYRLSIEANGDRCCDRQLALHSIVLVKSDGTRHLVLDEEHVADFSSRDIWRADIYPDQQMDLPFQDGMEIVIEIDISLITESGEIRRTLGTSFLANEFSGIRFFPLRALLYA